MISLLLLIPAIAAYSLSQLAQHNKLRWQDETKPFGFMGRQSHRRKYKNYNSASGERWFTSTTLTVFLTDFYHLMQFIFFLFLSASVAVALGFTWITFGLVWAGIHIIHFLIYKLLQR